MTWEENLLTGDNETRELLESTQRIAVLGIKPETRADQPAFYVPQYLLRMGYEIIPVPVYYPEVEAIMGIPVFRDLREIPGKIDMVNVFRRPADIDRHIDEIIGAKPDSVWFQLGIRNDDAAKKFAQAGIKVIQDKCIMVEDRVLLRKGH